MRLQKGLGKTTYRQIRLKKEAEQLSNKPIAPYYVIKANNPTGNRRKKKVVIPAHQLKGFLAGSCTAHKQRRALRYQREIRQEA